MKIKDILTMKVSDVVLVLVGVPLIVLFVFIVLFIVQLPIPFSGEPKAYLPSPITTPDICTEEKENILALVNTFENAQAKRDANGVLKLFTPSENSEDSATYTHLSGSDLAGPRLYSSGQTNFNQPSYKIIEEPQKNSIGGCTVEVEEMRSYYPQGGGGEFGPAQPYYVYFVMEKENDVWLIDSYLSSSTGSTHKFSGWGY